MSSVTGGPSAISSAFVPGRILRDASAAPPGKLFEYSDRPGDVGPLWSSAIGGGEGSRGDDEGETGVVIVCSAEDWYTAGLERWPYTQKQLLLFSSKELNCLDAAAVTCFRVGLRAVRA